MEENKKVQDTAETTVDETVETTDNTVETITDDTADKKEPATEAVVANTNAEPTEKKEKKKWLVALLILLTCSSIGVAVWAICFKSNSKADAQQPKPTDGPSILEPDKAPGNKEENAESMGDQGDKKLDQPEGGGAVSLTYSKDVTIDLSDKMVTLLFGNPSRSNQEMVVEIVIQNHIIVQSDILAPGYQVKKLALDDGSKLKPGIYSGKFKILYFDADTGEKAVVNTEIPIDIEVKQ